MSISHGMNIDQAQQLRSRMNTSANEIGQIVSQLNGQLNSTGWVGPDAERFRNDWSSVHVANLNKAKQALIDAATVLNSNINQQIQASGG